MRSHLCITVTAAVLSLASLARAQPARLSEEEVLARFRHEPTVQQVQDAAIRYYQVHPDRIRSLRNNAQLKALVPILQGGFANAISSEKRALVDALYRNLGNKEDEGTNLDSMAFTVGLTWNLDRLVFNAEVLDVQSLIGILDGVVREVTTIYYIRRRLQIDNLLRPPTDLASKISNTIRIEELTGLLDAMTGAFMSRSIRKAQQAERDRHRAPIAAPVPAPVPAAPPATASRAVPAAAMPASAAPTMARLPAKGAPLLAPR